MEGNYEGQQPPKKMKVTKKISRKQKTPNVNCEVRLIRLKLSSKKSSPESERERRRREREVVKEKEEEEKGDSSEEGRSHFLWLMIDYLGKITKKSLNI